jgi:hypothetical protein
MTEPTAWTNGEPRIDEVFADPIVQLIMRRDGESEVTLRRALDRLCREGRLAHPPRMGLDRGAPGGYP